MTSPLRRGRSVRSCPDCGQKVSAHAESCPHCGCPGADIDRHGREYRPFFTPAGGILLLLIIGAGAWIWFYRPDWIEGWRKRIPPAYQSWVPSPGAKSEHGASSVATPPPTTLVYWRQYRQILNDFPKSGNGASAGIRKIRSMAEQMESLQTRGVDVDLVVLVQETASQMRVLAKHAEMQNDPDAFVGAAVGTLADPQYGKRLAQEYGETVEFFRGIENRLSRMRALLTARHDVQFD